MKRAIHYTQLGGTLFIPASHKNLKPILLENRYPTLRSLLIDFEDGLDDGQLKITQKKFSELLATYSQQHFFVFIRPRDENHLKQILTIEYIEKIDGFILPKFSLKNGQNYLDILKYYDFSFMPSIEEEELFSSTKLEKLRDLLLRYKQNIVLVRFGLEDMLRQLGLKRGCEDSIFDLAVGNSVLGNFIAVFKSAGFAISGGVYPCFEDRTGFQKDVRRDLKEGLFSKTIIHPLQMEMVNELYKVSKKEFDEAKEIIESENVVFNQNGKMAEQKTMSSYANLILKRAEIYGINF